IVCGLSIAGRGVATYQRVVEKQIAIDCARRELVGVRYLGALRDAYAWALIAPAGDAKSRTEAIAALAAAEAIAGRGMRTAELATALATGLAELRSDPAVRTRQDVLAKARSLAVRIGDDSNLTLDPDLDTYYLQDTVVTKIPILIGQLSELQSLLARAAGADAPSPERRARALMVDGLLRSTMDDIRKNLATAYSGNANGSLRRAVDAAFA